MEDYLSLTSQKYQFYILTAINANLTTKITLRGET